LALKERWRDKKRKRGGPFQTEENDNNAAITSDLRIMYVTDVFTERGDTRRVTKPTC
jgi:hypothetical protein